MNSLCDRGIYRTRSFLAVLLRTVSPRGVTAVLKHVGGPSAPTERWEPLSQLSVHNFVNFSFLLATQLLSQK